MVDIKDIEKILANEALPEPHPDAKELAKTMAMKAFEAETKKTDMPVKGTDYAVRPIATIPAGMDKLIRRFTMKRYHLLAGGLAVCALTVTLSNTSILSTIVPVQPQLIEPVASGGGASVQVPEVAYPSQAAAAPAISTPAPLTVIHKDEKKHDAPAAESSAVSSDYDGAAKEKAVADIEQPLVKQMPGKLSIEAGQYPSSHVMNESDSRSRRIADYMPSEPMPATPYFREQGNDKFESVANNPLKNVAQEPVSTLSVDVDTASYSFMRRMVSQGQLPPADAVRVEEMINYFPYDYAQPESKAEPFKPTVAVYPSPWNSNTKLIHIGIKGYSIAQTQKPVSNLVFLLDVSGSMDSPDKLPLLKNAFKMLVDTLGEKDRVSIVVYAGSSGVVLEPTPAHEKEKIFAALNNLQAGGSTAGGEGIRRAYELARANFNKEGVNRVILATDGDFNVGITDPQELKHYVEKERESGVFLSVLGFGQGNYHDELMQKLAQNGNGNAAYIDSLSEARKVLVEEASSTLFTIAKDVKFQVEFNPMLVGEYRLIGYETRLLNREDFNNDKVDAGDIGAGHTVTAIYEITPKGVSSGHVDPLRYGENTAQKRELHVTDPSQSHEYAFLKMRYKLPDADKSILMTKPITTSEEFASVDALPTDIKFAAAVAAYGQMLAHEPYIKQYRFDDVITLAEAGKGADRFGYRSEFINLVRLAKTLHNVQ